MAKGLMDYLPLVTEDGSKAVTKALVAVGVPCSPLDLESAVKIVY